MLDDLRHFRPPSWWRDLADEEQARIAGALSVTAIVMLLVTSFTLARGPINAAPQGSPTATADSAAREKVSDVERGAEARVHAHPAGAAPFDCPRLQGRSWLRSAIWQQGDRTLAGVECFYGHAQAARFAP